MKTDKLHAFMFNAITRALGEADSWIPLNARMRATDAALAVIRPEVAYQAKADAGIFMETEPIRGSGIKSKSPPVTPDRARTLARRWLTVGVAGLAVSALYRAGLVYGWHDFTLLSGPDMVPSMLAFLLAFNWMGWRRGYLQRDKALRTD